MYNEADNVAALLERLAAVREGSGLDLAAIGLTAGHRAETVSRLR